MSSVPPYPHSCDTPRACTPIRAGAPGPARRGSVRRCYAGCRRRSPGLVSSSTSDSRLLVDPSEARARRCRRAVLTAARLHVQEVPRWRVAMLTLTYRPDVDWQPGHVTALAKRMRDWLRRRGHELRYVRVAELTRAGRVHYHMLVWLPRGITLPKPDKQGWWPHGSTRIEWARRAIGYLAKYASKVEDFAAGPEGRAFPRGLRLYAVGGLSGRARRIRAWWMLPAWLRDEWGSEHWPRRAVGGGWVSRLTGDWLPSPWRVSGFDLGRIVLTAC